MTDVEGLLGGRLFQVAFVVRDFDSALRRYTAVLGGAPWRCYTFSSAMHRACRYHGEPNEFSSRLALNGGSPQLELIQPLSGRSIHEDWLAERGEGLHHLGVVVESIDDSTQRMASAGYDVIQSGSGFGLDGDGVWAYFDTVRDLGFVVEAVEPSARFPEPESIWP